MKHNNEGCMFLLRWLALAALIWQSTSAWALLPPAPADFQSVYAQAGQSVVTVLTYATGGGSPTGVGSGFYVAPDVVVTNAHVVDGAGYVEVKKNLKDGPIRVLHIMAVDREADVALLRTAQTGVPLVLSPSSPGTGEPVVVISSPLGLEKTMSQGIVSGFRKVRGKHYVQLTASISPGSSGGPVLNRRGEVLGLTAFMLDGKHTQNLNFAIPSSVIRHVLDSQSSSPSQDLHIEKRNGEIVITD
jgi:S1-C subfamily serine protease